MAVSPAAQLRLTSFAGTNVALGTRGSVDGRNIGTRLTDGNRATVWNFLDDPEVLGKVILLDLSGDRLVDRVRVLPPVTSQSPEFFVKGYRIEVAPAGAPESWKVVAEEHLNARREVDTTVDSTWVRMTDGVPTPVIARYLRLTITRQDLPNRVEIGELEVLGAGYQVNGVYTSAVHDFGGLVNLGAASWQVDQPAGTSLRLQLRASADGSQWPDWEDVPPHAVTAATAVAAVAPVRFAQWRIEAATSDPFASPGITSVSVVYESRLVAHSAFGRVRPRLAPIGTKMALTYLADLQLAVGDRGVDLIALDRWGDVGEVRLNGVSLSPSRYQIVTAAQTSPQVPPLILHLDRDARISTSTRLELDFTTAFFAETAPVALLLGSDEGDTAVLQRVTPVYDDSIKVRVTGVLPALIPPRSVRVVPPVVCPRAPEGVRILFDLGYVQAAVPVSVSIHDLTGHTVRVLLDDVLLEAGPIAAAWDGRDRDGNALRPGIYLCRIRVDAECGQTVLKTIGVAY
jgi:hypothetical protein